jgi:hypothetical protein
MDAGLLDRLLPVATLLLGAGIARLGKRSDAKRVAAEQLAELRRFVWQKGGEDDWLNLQVFLGRLTVALRTAGVPQRLVSDLNKATRAHWHSVEDSGDPDAGWVVDGEHVERLDSVETRVLDMLDRPWHIRAPLGVMANRATARLVPRLADRGHHVPVREAVIPRPWVVWGKRSDGSRCPRHRRLNTAQRGHGASHQKRRPS